MSVAGRSQARVAELPTTFAVIAKEPVAGKVKTRLTPPLTPQEAATVAAACLTDTIAAVDTAARECGIGRRVLYFEGDADRVAPLDWDVIGQCGGGLGERLEALFADTDGPTIVVGMDTPQITAAAIATAVDELASGSTDAVLGPADDGGYWAIGFDRHVPGAFEGVPMSEERTASAQLARLDQLGIAVAMLEKLRDIDRWCDALEVAAANPGLSMSGVVRAVRQRLDTDEPTLHPSDD